MDPVVEFSEELKKWLHSLPKKDRGAITLEIVDKILGEGWPPPLETGIRNVTVINLSNGMQVVCQKSASNSITVYPVL